MDNSLEYTVIVGKHVSAETRYPDGRKLQVAAQEIELSQLHRDTIRVLRPPGVG